MMPFNRSINRWFKKKKNSNASTDEKVSEPLLLPLAFSLASNALVQAWLASAPRSVEMDNEQYRKSRKFHQQTHLFAFPSTPSSTLPPSQKTKKHHQSASAAPVESPPRWAPTTPTRSSPPSRGPRRRSPTDRRHRRSPPSPPPTPGSPSPRSGACTSSSRTPTCRASPPFPRRPLARAA